MQKIVTITDKAIINDILNSATYGVMALCSDNIPYSIPFNFVELNGSIYFHGSKKGKKIDIIKENSSASFSVVEEYSLIPSYFVTNSGDASPSSHLFSSVILDGKIELVEDYNEKVQGFKALMEKYQPEGKYKPLNNKTMYEKIINATGMFKLIPENISGKVKLGQNWKKEKFEKAIIHLQERGTKKDVNTIKKMKQLQEQLNRD